MDGKVILLGAGPGDPGLLTVRGKAYLEHADCVIYDRLASPDLLRYAPSGCERIFVGKENHHHTMKQEEINELLYRKAQEYPLVIRLKGGDPYVFGRGGEEALFLKERGIPVEVVPGITSSIAVPAAAGIPVTHRGTAQGFQVITAHSRKDAPAEIDYSQLLDPRVTCIFLMGLAHVGEIAEGLRKAGRKADTPAAVISHGTTAQQRTCIGTLADIGEKSKEAGLTSPSIIVVGDAVGLAEQLNFQEKRPLFGKKYIVPYIEKAEGQQPDSRERAAGRPDSELVQLLREAGAAVIPLKIGQIVYRKFSIGEFKEGLAADWLIFTSANGVRAFLYNMKQNGLDARTVGTARIAAIGKATAEELEKAFLFADLIPEKQNGEALFLELEGRCSPGSRMTLFAAEKSNPDLERKLRQRFSFRKLAVYENRPCPLAEPVQMEGSTVAEKAISETSEAKRMASLEQIVCENGKADGILFTSASAVKRTLRMSKEGLPGEVYSIGPKCSEELRKQGICDYTEAEESSYQGLLKEVLRKNNSI